MFFFLFLHHLKILPNSRQEGRQRLRERGRELRCEACANFMAPCITNWNMCLLSDSLYLHFPSTTATSSSLLSLSLPTLLPCVSILCLGSWKNAYFYCQQGDTARRSCNTSNDTTNGSPFPPLHLPLVSQQIASKMWDAVSAHLFAFSGSLCVCVRECVWHAAVVVVAVESFCQVVINKWQIKLCLNLFCRPLKRGNLSVAALERVWGLFPPEYLCLAGR